jgi:hypothetical protein
VNGEKGCYRLRAAAIVLARDGQSFPYWGVSAEFIRETSDAGGRLAVTDSSDGDAGRPDDKPHGSQSPDETSGLDGLSSLKSYFSDRGRERTLRPFSDWLRGKAHAILSDEAGEPKDLFDFSKGWLNEKLLSGRRRMFSRWR